MCVSASARSFDSLRPSLLNHHTSLLIPRKPILPDVRARDCGTQIDVCEPCHQKAAHSLAASCSAPEESRSSFEGNSDQVRPYVRPVRGFWGRWPSWVYAYVSGTNLCSVLEGTPVFPVLPETVLDHSPSHHVCSELPAGAAYHRTCGRLTPQLSLRHQHAPSRGRPRCASSTPKRCAQSCSPAPPSLA